MTKDNRKLVSLTILGGYTARQMFTLVDNLVGEIPITLYSDRFEIKHANILDETTGRKIVVNFVPKMDDILVYETDQEHFDKNDVLVLTPSVKNFSSYVTSTSKKDSLEFKCFSDHPDTMFVNIIKSGSSGTGGSNFKNINFKQYDIIRTETSGEKTNIKIPLNDMCILCSSINKAKNQYKNTKFIGYKNGVVITGVGHTDVASLGNKWGTCIEEEKIGEYILAIEHNKALSIIQNITESGVVAMFFKHNVLKMKFPVGCYGEMTVVFDNGQDISKDVPVVVPVREQPSDNEMESSEDDDDEYWSS